MTTDDTGHRLAVIGAGVMGTNISTLALGHGVPVMNRSEWIRKYCSGSKKDSIASP